MYYESLRWTCCWLVVDVVDERYGGAAGAADSDMLAGVGDLYLAAGDDYRLLNFVDGDGGDCDGVGYDDRRRLGRQRRHLSCHPLERLSNWNSIVDLLLSLLPFCPR